MALRVATKNRIVEQMEGWIVFVMTFLISPITLMLFSFSYLVPEYTEQILRWPFSQLYFFLFYICYIVYAKLTSADSLQYLLSQLRLSPHSLIHTFCFQATRVLFCFFCQSSVLSGLVSVFLVAFQVLLKAFFLNKNSWHTILLY